MAVALAAHALVLGVRGLSRRILRSRATSEAKIQTVTSFFTSLLVFAVYFGAGGFVLSELGVSLTTYLASASVIGLAVSFGSQGVVQDVITGLTVVFSDLLDIGDLVELGGQVGIVESVGIRFTVLVNFAGARVYVPNRTVTNVVSYPAGFVRVFLDARLPEDPSLWPEAERKIATLMDAAYEQHPGILLVPPTLEGRAETRAGYGYVRIKFRIWPGQAAVIEQAVKPSIVQAMKRLDSSYGDWMVTVHHRAEPKQADERRRLPRPAALRARERRRSA